MANSNNKNWLQRHWEALSPMVRRVISIGSIAIVGFAAIYTFVSSEPPQRKRQVVDRNDVQREIFTQASPRETNLHGLAAAVTDMEKKNKILQREIESLRNQLQIGPESAGVAAEAYQEIETKAVEAAKKATEEALAAHALAQAEAKALAEEMKDDEKGETQEGQAPKTEASPVTVVAEERPSTITDGMAPIDLEWGTLPVAQAMSGQKGAGQGAPAQKGASKLRHISAAPTKAEVAAEQANKKEKEPEDVFIPAGSIFSGTLITGMDAPTGTQAKKTPFPALLRIKKEALLPNRYRADVRECFLIASGYGDLSSERVYLRSETISCVRNDGGVIEAPIDMYAAGEDGKAGVRGKLDTKQGQYLARALAAGFLQSVASVFNEVPTATISTTASNTLPFQSAFSDQAAQSAAVQGVGNAMDRLANFYIDMAQSVFPIVQVDAGRQVDFIMTRGTSLKLR